MNSNELSERKRDSERIALQVVGNLYCDYSDVSNCVVSRCSATVVSSYVVLVSVLAEWFMALTNVRTLSAMDILR